MPKRFYSKELNAHVSKVIQQIMHREKLKAAQLANTMGIPVPMIYKYLEGKHSASGLFFDKIHRFLTDEEKQTAPFCYGDIPTLAQPARRPPDTRSTVVRIRGRMGTRARRIDELTEEQNKDSLLIQQLLEEFEVAKQQRAQAILEETL
jgi:transcriptional regulator with XRE-family HTH domain